MEISSVREYLKIIEQLEVNYTYQKQLAPNAMDSTHKEHFRNMVGNRMMQ